MENGQVRNIDTVVVHCSATPPNMDVGVAEIRRWHVDGNGWSDVGYHYVIRRDGTVEEGRPVDRAGAHARGHNRASIGVCLVGGVDHHKDSLANFTRSQWAALSSLVDQILQAYGPLRVVGHRDLDAGKDCPCFDVAAWYCG